MDGAFDRLYAAFSEKEVRSVDGELRAATFQCLDHYSNDINAPAAHDHYFICFTPILSAFMSSRRLDIAERVWELAFEPVLLWEQLPRPN